MSLVHQFKMADFRVFSFIPSLLLVFLLLLWAPPVQSYPDGGRIGCPRDNFNTTAKTANCSKSLALQKGGLIFVKVEFDGGKSGKLSNEGVQSCGGVLMTSNGSSFPAWRGVTIILVTYCTVWCTHCMCLASPLCIRSTPSGRYLQRLPLLSFLLCTSFTHIYSPLHDMSSLLCCVVFIWF